MNKKQTKVIATRVTECFAGLIEQHCKNEAYINCSDLIREALREKLQKEAPELYKKLLGGIN